MKCNTIPELERFLSIQQQALGPATSEVATTLFKLAELYLAKGDIDKAENLYRRSFDIRATMYGVNREGIELTEQRLEGIKTVRESSATLPAIKATEALGASGGPSSPLHADTASGAAGALSKPEEHDATPGSISAHPEPSAHCQKITSGSSQSILAAISDTELELELLVQMVGHEHPSVADLLTKLADLYCRVRMYNKMEPLLVDALKIRELACGADHPSVATELKNLGTLYCAQERYGLAEPLLKRAIGLREKAYGPMHPRVADVEAQYAQLLRKTNRIVLAEALERHIGDIRSGQNASTLFSCDSSLFGAAKPRR